MTSLAVTSSNLKASMKFRGTSFKFWLRPWNTRKNGPEKTPYLDTFHAVVLYHLRKYFLEPDYINVKQRCVYQQVF